MNPEVIAKYLQGLGYQVQAPAAVSSNNKNEVSALLARVEALEKGQATATTSPMKQGIFGVTPSPSNVLTEELILAMTPEQVVENQDKIRAYIEAEGGIS